MRRDPEKTYEKILEVSSKLFFEKGYENTSLQDIVNNLDGLTKGAVYHHFSSKDDILDAIEDKLLVENNPFKKVLVYSELTGIELIKKAFLLGIDDQEQQYYNKISMKIWRQSEKIQSPKMIAKMIEINKNILAPDLCKIVEKGIKDGSVDTKYPMEISEQILLQINIGLLLAISDITEKELTGKIEFISEWTKNMGVDFLDKELKYINYNDDNLLLQILTITEKIININNIKPYELSIIYKKIFNKYFPNQKLKINNFYLRNNLEKEHFLVFDYNNFYYSYNYNKQKFIKLGYDYLIENIKNKKIGLYQNEEFDITRERVVL